MDLGKVKPIIQLALGEDIGPRDLTTELLIPPNRRGKAIIVANQSGIVCGLEVIKEVFRMVDTHYRTPKNLKIKFASRLKDGAKIKRGEEIIEISGSGRTILTGERTALNFFQRLSGIATLTRKYVKAVHSPQSTVHGPKVFDTRKTTPGLRYLEKYAVHCGGGWNHRMGLWDGVLVKDNHLRILRKIRNPKSEIRNQKIKVKKGMKVEIEAENLAEVRQALEAGAEIIMLDNFPAKILRKAIQLIRSAKGQQCEIEVSGRISLKNIKQIAKLDINRISVGALTKSAPALDFSLEITR